MSGDFTFQRTAGRRRQAPWRALPPCAWPPGRGPPAPTCPASAPARWCASRQQKVCIPVMCDCHSACATCRRARLCCCDQAVLRGDQLRDRGFRSSQRHRKVLLCGVLALSTRCRTQTLRPLRCAADRLWCHRSKQNNDGWMPALGSAAAICLGAGGQRTHLRLEQHDAVAGAGHQDAEPRRRCRLSASRRADAGRPVGAHRHPHSADRPRPRQRRHRQRRGGGVNRQHLGVVHPVGAQHIGGDLPRFLAGFRV